MTNKTIAGVEVEFDDQGFMQKVDQWNEEIAKEIAHEYGVEDLTDRHWIVIHFMRDAYLANGTAPSIRALGKTSGVSVKELYKLFPKGPAKLAARVGGIPKPKGCI